MNRTKPLCLRPHYVRHKNGDRKPAGVKSVKRVWFGRKINGLDPNKKLLRRARRDRAAKRMNGPCTGLEDVVLAAKWRARSEFLQSSSADSNETQAHLSTDRNHLRHTMHSQLSCCNLKQITCVLDGVRRARWSTYSEQGGPSSTWQQTLLLALLRLIRAHADTQHSHAGPETYRHTYRHTQTDRQTDRQRARQTVMHTHRDIDTVATMSPCWYSA